MPDQNGWLRKRHRKSGDIWAYCHRRRRFDGKWVEATESWSRLWLSSLMKEPHGSVWTNLGSNPHAHLLERNPRLTFGELAAHYVKFELRDDQSNATIEKARLTIIKYKHYLNRWALPRWQRTAALAVSPFEVETWFKEIEQEHHYRIVRLRNPWAKNEETIVLSIVARLKFNRSDNFVSGWGQARILVAQPLSIAFVQHGRCTTATLGQIRLMLRPCSVFCWFVFARQDQRPCRRPRTSRECRQPHPPTFPGSFCRRRAPNHTFCRWTTRVCHLKV